MEKTREFPALFVPSNFLPRGLVIKQIFITEEQKAVMRHLLAKGCNLSNINGAENFCGTFVMLPYKPSKNVIIREDKIQSNRKYFNGLGIEYSVRSCAKAGNSNNLILMLCGEHKVRMLYDVPRLDQFAAVRVNEVSDSGADSPEADGLRRKIEALVKKIVGYGLIKKEEVRWLAECVNQNNIYFFSDSLIYVMGFCFEKSLTDEERRSLYKEPNVVLRLKKIADALLKEDDKMALRKREADEQKKADKENRWRALLEQRKQVEKDLKECDPAYVPDSELDQEFDERIFQTNMPPETERVARKELRRLKDAGNNKEEATKLRTYLEWLCDVPWNKRSDDVFDVARARVVLDEDHYDLEKIKKRIVEYIAVLKLNPNKKGPILCLVGPPGVGKTSLGKSIARALGRKFASVRLGGVKDEAEIRGHRRTYIGALPGRIIQKMKEAGTVNPVFMLDEIDKLSHDSKDDPSAALLEVLDLEHNHEFSDHYLEVPYDLSNVIFICTANSMDPVPPVLKDRLEILDLSGYTRQEKLQIAKRFLIPKQLAEHGADNKNIDITDSAIGMIVDEYTREAGVRQLEREIANIIRDRAVLIAEKKSFESQIGEKEIPEILGSPKCSRPERVKFTAPGNIACMAWTEYGGRVFIVELMNRGKIGNDSPRFFCTGKLGEIMQESALVAYSCAYNYLQREGSDLTAMEEDCFHLHCPEGAVPKEGASAGLPFALNIISFVTKKIVRSDVAVAGEIAIRSGGQILAIRGVKERLLAAHRAGYKIAIMPEKNRADLRDIPDEVKKDMDIRLVRTLSEAVKIVFV